MSSAIRDVGLTLVELLRDTLVADPPTNDQPIASRDHIALLSPRDVNQNRDVRLTLFLFSITPTVELRNEFEIPGNRSGDEPISEPLDLYYLLTAFAPATQDPTEQTLDAQLLLGFAMRVLFDNGILTGSVLRGNLPRDEELRLTLQPMTVEDLTRIWSVFPDSVLHASVSFVVSPVRLLSTRSRGGHRIVSRQSEIDRAEPINTEGVVA